MSSITKQTRSRARPVNGSEADHSESSRSPSRSIVTSRYPSEIPADALSLVRSTLNELLQDGSDGGPGYRGGLSNSQKSAYQQFFEFKSTHLSKAQFVEPGSLSREYVEQARDSGVPLDNLIHLANLVSFLFLVLDSGPDPVTKTRPSASAKNLKEASLQMLKTAAKPSDEIDETWVRLVIDLKRQAFISAASQARKPAASHYPSQEPWASHVRADPPPRRALRFKFQELQKESTEKLKEVGLDPNVVETAWRWEDVVDGARAFVRRQCATTLEEEAETAILETDDGTDGGSAALVSHRDMEQEDESGSEGFAGPETGPLGEDNTEDLRSKEDEGDRNEQMQSEHSSTTSRSRSKSSRSPNIDAISDDQSGDDVDSDDEMDLQPDGFNLEYFQSNPQDMNLVNDMGLDDGSGPGSSEPFGGEETAQPQPRSPRSVPSVLSLGQSESDEGPSSQSRGAPRTRIAIDKGGIALVPQGKKGRSWLTKQPDAERISFDTQSQDRSHSESRSRSLSTSTHSPRLEDRSSDARRRGLAAKTLGHAAGLGAHPRSSAQSQPLPSTSRSRPFPSSSQPLSPVILPKKTTSQKRKLSAGSDSRGSEGETSGRFGTSREEANARRSSKIKVRPKRKPTEFSDDSRGKEENSDDDDDEEEEEAISIRKKKRSRLAIEEKKARAETTRVQIVRPPGSGNIYYQGKNVPGGRNSFTSEEVALLHRCLEDYGTSWKRMIEEHGREGSSSRVFALRNNVSLKDKAVNIKKNLINNGLPIPRYLDSVHVPESKLKTRSREVVVMSNGTDVEDEDDYGDEDEEA